MECLGQLGKHSRLFLYTLQISDGGLQTRTAYAKLRKEREERLQTPDHANLVKLLLKRWREWRFAIS